MKTRSVLLSAALAGGLLFTAVSSFASTDAATGAVVAPTIAKAVPFESMPTRYQGSSLQLSMLVDETGTPQQIKPVGHAPADLMARLLPAVSQWKFTPAMKDGHPVAVRVILPVELSSNN